MPAVLRQPLPPIALLLAMVGLGLAVAFYCLAYASLAGEPESFGEALAWAVANVLPWFLAFETGKRATGPAARSVALLLAFAASMVLGSAFAGSAGEIGFEALRRVPALLIVILLFGLGRIGGARGVAAEESVELLLRPEQIDWIAAAGNYVEIRGCGRTLVRRASLAGVERQLAGHGFVRIHRSCLVRRDRIARIRPADVILADGTSLKTGKRYRATLTG